MTLTRWIAGGSLVAAGVVALALAVPSPSHAGYVCYYAGAAYSVGSCRSGQRCKLGGDGTGGYYGYWDDDSNCPQAKDGKPVL